MKYDEIMDSKTILTPLKSPFKQLFKGLPFNYPWRMSLTGDAGAGKSTFLIKFASFLAENGKFLYVAAEEPNETGNTFKEKLSRVRFSQKSKNNLEVADMDNPNDLFSELKKGYKYCVIDSIQVLCDDNVKTGKNLLRDLKNEFPKTAFIFVLQQNKDGSMRGGTGWKFNIEIVAEIEKIGGTGIFRFTKNRYSKIDDLPKYDVFGNVLLLQRKFKNKLSGEN